VGLELDVNGTQQVVDGISTQQQVVDGETKWTSMHELDMGLDLVNKAEEPGGMPVQRVQCHSKTGTYSSQRVSAGLATAHGFKHNCRRKLKF